MIRGVIFDFDGVLVTTDELHYQSWKQVTDEEGIPFDREINERLRGVDRFTSLEIVLEKAGRPYLPEQKAALADRKNAIFQKMIDGMTLDAMLAGALEKLEQLRSRGIKTGLASSSRNAVAIIRRLGIAHLFDALVDANDVATHKPDPALFLLVARRLALEPQECLVIEDAVAGVQAAKAARMQVLGVGTPEKLPNAPRLVASLEAVELDQLLNAANTMT